MLNKNSYVVPEQEPLIIFDRKSAIFVSKNGKDAKPTRHTARRMHFVRNGEEWRFQKTVWCELGMKLVDIVTKNVR